MSTLASTLLSTDTHTHTMERWYLFVKPVVCDPGGRWASPFSAPRRGWSTAPVSQNQAVTCAPHRTLATVPAVASLCRVTLNMADVWRLELACVSAFRSISSSIGSQLKYLKIFLKTFNHQELGTKTCSSFLECL